MAAGVPFESSGCSTCAYFPDAQRVSDACADADSMATQKAGPVRQCLLHNWEFATHRIGGVGLIDRFLSCHLCTQRNLLKTAPERGHGQRTGGDRPRSVK